jgi:hypothetical protein
MKPQTGRPPVPLAVRADNYLRRINTLSRRIKRLEKKNRLQLDLIKMLQKDVSNLS